MEIQNAKTISSEENTNEIPIFKHNQCFKHPVKGTMLLYVYKCIFKTEVGNYSRGEELAGRSLTQIFLTIFLQFSQKSDLISLIFFFPE